MTTVGSILVVDVATWENQQVPNEYPIQRSWQWTRNGIDIPGAIGGVYTLQTADIGQQIAVRETAGYVNTVTNTVTATFTSTSVPVVPAGGPLDPYLVYENNLSYLGSFRMPPTYFAYQGEGLTFNSSGYNGQKTLLSVANVYSGMNPDILRAGEFSIPMTLTNVTSSTTLSSIQQSTLLRPLPTPLDPFEGGISTSGVEGDSINEIGGFQTISNNKLLMTYYSAYQNSISYGVFYRRPFDLSTTTQVEGPFVVIDPIHQTNPRWTTGWMCNIPDTLVNGVNYRNVFGGDVLAGANGLSIINSSSDGPAAIAFNSSDIDTVLTNRSSGLARGGSSDTIILATTASSVTGAYVGHYIVAVTASTGTRQIIAYDGPTRTATISANRDNKLWDRGTPTTLTEYKTVPPLSGTQLIGYSVGETTSLQSGYHGAKFAPIWGRNAQARSMVIPNGTRSLLFFGYSGDGFLTYGTPGSISSNGSRIYDPIFNYQTNHGYPYSGKIWAYDLAEMAQVRTGSKTFNDIKPYAVMPFKLPGAGTFGALTPSGVAYDPSTKRLYMTTTVNDPYQGGYGQVLVHVYEVSNASISGLVITTTDETLPEPVNGRSYSAQLLASGASGSLVWSLASGSVLPTGLTLSSTGLISGTPPTTAGPISVTIIATDSITSTRKTFSISVLETTGRQVDSSDGTVLAEISAARLANQATFGASLDLMNYIKNKDANSQIAAAKWLQEQLSLTGANLSEYRSLIRGSSIIHDYDSEVAYIYPRTWVDVPVSEGGPLGAVNQTGLYAGEQLDGMFEFGSYGTGSNPVIVDFFRNATDKPDQLRQRIAFFLSQIMVATDNVVKASYGLARFHQKFLDNALGNYRNLLVDIIKDPFMGEFLTSVNNDKSGPNENFAREIMQLFSLGSCVLNMNGTYATPEQIGTDPGPSDPGGNGCVPTYDNSVVREFAFALSGWTYPPGANRFQFSDYDLLFPWCNRRYYGSGRYPNNLGPNNMINKDGRNLTDADYQDPVKFKALVGHGRPDDTPTSKPKIQLFKGPAVGGLLGNTVEGDFNIPAITGLTRRDGESALQTVVNAIMSHQNLWPWVSIRFIKHFVTSNPSKEYVHRVATAFKNGTYTNSGITFGTGVKGDMKALIAAVLLDSEARQLTGPQTAPEFGKLREPVLYYTSMCRVMNGKTDGWSEYRNGGSMTASEQMVFRPPSVFNFYNLLYNVPGTSFGDPPKPLAGPEFGILNTNSMNWRFSEVYNNLLANYYFQDEAGPQFFGPSFRFDNAAGYSRNYDVFAPWAGGAGLAGILTLIDRMDIVMCNGQLTKEEKDVIAAFVKQKVDDVWGESPNTIVPGQTGYKKVKYRIHFAMAAIFTSKNFNVIK